MTSTTEWIQVTRLLVILIVLQFLSYTSDHSTRWISFTFVSSFLASPVSGKFEFSFQIISIYLPEMISIIIVYQLVLNFMDIFLHPFTHLATHLTQCLWNIGKIIKTRYYANKTKPEKITKEKVTPLHDFTIVEVKEMHTFAIVFQAANVRRL